jgi:hypothetical protein
MRLCVHLQDDLSSQTEVTLEKMSTDEEFKTDTVYGER